MLGGWFRLEMLSTTRMRRLCGALYRKDISCQVRHDDGVEHFRRVSKRHPAIRFVMVYADPNVDDIGSAFIERARRGGTASRRP